MDKAIELVKEEMKLYNDGEGGDATWGAYVALKLLLEKLEAAQQSVAELRDEKFDILNTVFLLTSGDGSDGNEWSVISIHSSRELAQIAQVKYSEPQKNIFGGTYIRESEIEEWTVDENAAQQVEPIEEHGF